MKNVNGMLSNPVITANHGPSAGGTTLTMASAIAVTMPVPSRSPTSTAAANTMATTATMELACALTRSD